MCHCNGENTNNDEPEQRAAPNTEHHDVSLSLDAILSLLADRQRRDLLGFLVDTSDQAAAVDECVSHLVKREEERTGERPGHDQVVTSLHHVHLPKLADAGVLEYDARSRELRYWGHGRLETWLDRIRTHESEPD